MMVHNAALNTHFGKIKMEPIEVGQHWNGPCKVYRAVKNPETGKFEPAELLRVEDALPDVLSEV